jgi:hypothetical protein
MVETATETVIATVRSDGTSTPRQTATAILVLIRYVLKLNTKISNLEARITNLETPLS